MIEPDGASAPPPVGLGSRGLAFWRAAADGFELAIDEHELLLEIARALDLAEALQRELDEHGVMAAGSAGQPVAHPAIASLNATRQVLGRLLAQLSLPGEDDEPTVISPASAQARKAANVRWQMERARQGRRGA